MRICARPVGRRGRDHAAFAGREVLGRVEAEAREVGGRADLAAARHAFDAVRGVFDREEPMARGQLSDRGDVRRPAAVVHGDDRARPVGDRGGGRVRIEIARPRIDVREHRRRAGVDDDVRRRAEGQRRRDDFVARPHASGEQRQMQARRARIQRPPRAARRCRRRMRLRTRRTRGPVEIQPDSSVRTTSAISSGPMSGGENGTRMAAVATLMRRTRPVSGSSDGPPSSDISMAAAPLTQAPG